MDSVELDFEKLSIKDKVSDIESINKRIQNEICFETIKSLSDENLLEEYKSCKSTINEIKKLKKVLIKSEIIEDKIVEIINNYILELINPGTKGVIRGNKFNKIVQSYILDLKFLREDEYEIQFEKKSERFETSEIPDWYIYNKKKDKIMIGMNQLDLWGGGQQTNRGSKYILDFKNDEKVKLVCVICNEITIKTKKSKVYTLFEKGFENDTLCYLKNLDKIIESYFK